jgi:hypothetical protein
MCLHLIILAGVLSVLTPIEDLIQNHLADIHRCAQLGNPQSQ